MDYAPGDRHMHRVLPAAALSPGQRTSEIAMRLQPHVAAHEHVSVGFGSPIQRSQPLFPPRRPVRVRNERTVSL
jgi:hypothetical protein